MGLSGPDPLFFILLLENQIPGETPGSSYRNPDWAPLTEVIEKNDEIKETYIELMLGGHRPSKTKFDVFYFGSGPQMAAKLAHLVVKGKKRGTAGWVKTHERTNTAIPQVGGLSLVTDGFGIPLCFINTVKVEFLKFEEVTEEMAQIEGEGDLSLSDWKRGHKKFWESYDAQEINEPFTEDEIIFFETFQVTQVLGQADVPS